MVNPRSLHIIIYSVPVMSLLFPEKIHAYVELIAAAFMFAMAVPIHKAMYRQKVV